MNETLYSLARGALGRQLSEDELGQVAASGGSDGAQRAELVRRAYSLETELTSEALKAFFRRQKAFGKSHNYSYQKCQRDTLIFYRSLVLAGLTGDSSMLVTEVRTWFITILETVKVHLDETYQLWTALRIELQLKADEELRQFMQPHLEAALDTIRQAMEEKTASRLRRNG